MIIDNDSTTAYTRKTKHNEDETVCSVSGCKEKAIRSLSMKKVQSALSNVDTVGKRAYLCKKHYKEFKKKTKDERELERAGWN